MTDSHSLVHLSDSLHDMMIQRTILSDLTPIMADSNASNSKHKISWIADLQTTVTEIAQYLTVTSQIFLVHFIQLNQLHHMGQ